MVLENQGRRDETFPTTRDAYAMRRLVKELMVGPLDKNGCGGALAVLRPTLYTAGCMCIKPKAAKAMTASRAADRVLEGVPSEAEGEKSTRECARDSTLP